MSFKQAFFLMCGLMILGCLTGLGVFMLPRVINGQAAPEDRLKGIRRRLPATIPPNSVPIPGMVIPPFARDELGLTGTQQLKLTDLERDVADRLKDLLTPEQMAKFAEFLQQGPDRTGERK